jgi:hypothetical protein
MFNRPRQRIPLSAQYSACCPSGCGSWRSPPPSPCAAPSLPRGVSSPGRRAHAPSPARGLQPRGGRLLFVREKGRIRSRIRASLLMDPDPDPGGPKTSGSCRSGSESTTLGVNQSFKPKITSVMVDEAERSNADTCRRQRLQYKKKGC